MNTQWKKNCPKCGKEQVYGRKEYLNKAFRKNLVCKKCKDDQLRIVSPNDGWKRKCPKCNIEIIYKTKPLLVKATKRNSACNKCKYELMIIPIPSGGWSRKCPSCNEIIVYENKKGMDFANQYNRICKSCAMKISTEKYPRCIPCSEDRKRKARISTIDRLNRTYGKYATMIARSSPNACKFMDEYGKKSGYSFRHALNGGEVYIEYLGYFVDGYDKDRNVVFEYDEPRHYYKNGNGKLKLKDINRMNEIRNHLHCKFIRYNERCNEIEEY